MLDVGVKKMGQRPDGPMGEEWHPLKKRGGKDVVGGRKGEGKMGIRGLPLSTKTEYDYLYGWIRGKNPCVCVRKKISPKILKPRDLAENAEQEEEEASSCPRKILLRSCACVRVCVCVWGEGGGVAMADTLYAEQKITSVPQVYC